MVNVYYTQKETPVRSDSLHRLSGQWVGDLIDAHLEYREQKIMIPCWKKIIIKSFFYEWTFAFTHFSSVPTNRHLAHCPRSVCYILMDNSWNFIHANATNIQNEGTSELLTCAGKQQNYHMSFFLSTLLRFLAWLMDSPGPPDHFTSKTPAGAPLVHSPLASLMLVAVSH